MKLVFENYSNYSLLKHNYIDKYLWVMVINSDIRRFSHLAKYFIIVVLNTLVSPLFKIHEIYLRANIII